MRSDNVIKGFSSCVLSEFCSYVFHPDISFPGDGVLCVRRWDAREDEKSRQIDKYDFSKNIGSLQTHYIVTPKSLLTLIGL